jgi:hypothetical protein
MTDFKNIYKENYSSFFICFFIFKKDFKVPESILNTNGNPTNLFRWPVAYHGTKELNVLDILRDGLRSVSNFSTFLLEQLF